VRVLLVNPPRSPWNEIRRHAPEEAKRFIHRRLVGPPLGLLTLAGALKDHDVTVLEMKGEYDLDPEAPPPARLLERYLDRVKPQIVGVTFIASEHPGGMELLRETKRFDPEILTVAGGLHAIVCPDDFDDPAVDVVYRAQAPHPFVDLVRAREAGRGLDHIGGIRVRREGRSVPTPEPVRERDCAGLDYVRPDRSHLARWLETYRVGRQHSGRGTYVFTSLGCPFRCSFCSIWTQFGGSYHQREVESVVDELKTLDDYEIVRFSDANTVVDVHFAHRLFDRIREEGIDKTYVMDLRSDTVVAHPDLIGKMARGGLKVAIVGFESHRQGELDRYGKGTEAAAIGEAVRILHDQGVMVRGNYVVPPDYVAADFESLAEFAAGRRVSYSGYTILTPLPGSRFHEEVKDRIVDHDLAKYNLFNCVMRTALPLEKFYEEVGRLWLIRLGEHTI